ncbi:MAG: M24 family metallopeptidase [Deinococcus sp.]|nr:M24 family metallopeptidase [Deinococcus sp.]
MGELEAKLKRVNDFMKARGLGALLLARSANFAWLSCGGGSHIYTATDGGVASLLVTQKGRYFITNNIEAQRLLEEEGLGAQGWELRSAPWHGASTAVAELTKGLQLGSDVPWEGAQELSGDIARLRWSLLDEELGRFRLVGKLAGEAIGEAARGVRPGMSEHQIAGLLAQAVWSRGGVPVVVLVATDQRIFTRRHPLPTDRKMERYAMLVVCARRWGLVASATRLVHKGKVAQEVRDKAKAVATIDAVFMSATKPGARVADIFRRAVATYAQTGYAEEWQLHHQGGLAGYLPREYIATAQSQEVVGLHQAFAWNPSITGTKSEDTILVGEKVPEIITATPDWPTVAVSIEGQSFPRPGIWEI